MIGAVNATVLTFKALRYCCQKAVVALFVILFPLRNNDLNLLIAGASGFIGGKLVTALQSNHTITVLGRDIATLHRHFCKPVTAVSWDSLPTLNDKATFFL